MSSVPTVISASSSIQAAIDALPSTGGTIHLPAGTYPVGATVNVNKPNVRIIGDGIGNTVITFNSANVTMFAITKDACSIEGLTITNDTSFSPSAGSGVGIDVGSSSESLSRILLRRLRLENVPSYGIRFKAKATSPAMEESYSCNVQDVEVINSQSNACIYVGRACTTIVFERVLTLMEGEHLPGSVTVNGFEIVNAANVMLNTCAGVPHPTG